MSLENSLREFVKRARGGRCEAGSILQLNGNVHQLPLREEGTGLEAGSPGDRGPFFLTGGDYLLRTTEACGWGQTEGEEAGWQFGRE